MGAYGDYSAVGQYLRILVDVDTTYEISGYFDVTDVGPSGYVSLGFTIYNPLGGNPFENYQSSYHTVNESFTLGQFGGERSFGHGSQSGTLAPGPYDIFWNASLNATPEADQGASAVGNVTIKFGSGGILAAVPEPTSFAIWSLGLIGMTIACRHRRTQIRSVQVRPERYLLGASLSTQSDYKRGPDMP